MSSFTRTLTLTQISTAGPDRVTASFNEVVNPGVGAVPQPMSVSSFNLNLSQNEAASLEVNSQYTLTLSDAPPVE